MRINLRGVFFTALLAAVLFPGCRAAVQTGIWQELDGDSIVRFIDTSNVYFFKDIDSFSYLGKYSSNNMYIDDKIYSFEKDDTSLTVSYGAEEMVFKKADTGAAPAGIAGEWVGRDDNFVLLDNGLGLYINNETGFLRKEVRYITYSGARIYDAVFGACAFSLDKNTLKVTLGDSEKEYIRKSGPADKANITGFWEWEEDGETFFFVFTNSGLVIDNYFSLGGLSAGLYYNGNIYSRYGKMEYAMENNILTIHINYNMRYLSEEKDYLVISPKKVSGTALAGVWKNDPAGDVDEVTFFNDGTVVFSNSPKMSSAKYVYNNGNIYQIDSFSGWGKILYSYEQKGDTLALTKLKTQFDILKKITITLEDGEEYTLMKSR